MTCKICGGDHTAPTSGQTGEPRLEKCVASLAERLAPFEAALKAEAERQGLVPLNPIEAAEVARETAPEPVPALKPSPVDLAPAAEPVKEG